MYYYMHQLVSNFILCRALIEIIRRLTKETLPNDLGHKLEEMVFAQLRNIDRSLLSAIASCRDLGVDTWWVIKGAQIRFDYPEHEVSKTQDLSDGMPGGDRRLAYAEVFAELLEPIASVAQAEVNLPAWMMSIESIFSKAMRMSAKRVYQHVAIPLITTVLCVSKKEFFLKNWPPLVEICLQKFRDRQLKTMAFNCVTRLVWVYLFRSCDPLSINSQRRIESLLKVLFPVKSRIIVPQDTTLDFFVRLVHIVLSTINYKSVMAAVSGTSAGTSSIIIGDSAINPERLIIALRSFLLLLADIEEALKGGISLGGGNMYGALGGGDSNPSPFGAGYTAASVSTVGFVVVEGKVKIPQPPFPLSNLSLSGGIEPLAAMLHRQAAPQDKNPFTPLEIKDSQKPVLNAALSDKILSRMSSSVREYLDRVNAVLGRVAVGLDKVCGQHLWKNVIPANEGGTGGLGLDPGQSERSPAMSSDGAAMTSRDKPVLYDLMKNYIDCLPRFTPSGENDEMGGKVFWTLGDKARPGASLLQGVLRILGNTLAIAINDRIATSLVIGESTEGVLRSGGLGLYVDLLELWLKEFKDGKGKGYDEEEVERILCDIEGRGLLYLCSTSVTIRKMGLQIVRLVPAFEKQLSGMTEEAEAEGPASRARSNDGTPELRRRQALYRPSRPSFSSKRAPTIFKTTGNSRLKPQRSRIIQIMEQSGHDLVSRHYLDPTVAVGSMKYESQKYQTQHQQNLLRLLGMKDSLCVIASSSNAQECSIWYRCFPDLVQWFYEYANPKALRICLTDVFARIVALHPSIQVASDFPSSTKLNGNSMRWVTSSPAGSNAALNSGIGTGQGTNGVMPATDNIIDQWKVYLTFACATIEVSRTSGSVMEKSIFGAPNSNRRMGNSDSEELLSKEKALTPGQLFTMMLPLLSCERNSIRQCLVSSLGAVHSLSYKTLLEGLQPLIRNVTEDMRMRPIRTSESSMGGVSAAGKKSTSNQAQVAMISNIKRLERLRVEITHLMSLIADFVVYEVYRSNDALVKPVVTYIRDVAKFLSSSDVKAEWDYQMLRYYYCAMVGRFYERLLNVAESGTGEITKFPASIKPGGNAKGVDAQRIFPYELRASLFLLFEQWCGYGAHAIVFLDRETKTMLSALDPIKDNREKGVIASTMDEQLKVLANAALKAMATLIKGPILPDVEGSIPYSGPEYKVDDIFSWLNDMFRSPDDAIHSVALSAIEALILNNPSREDILEHAVRECYIRAPISPGAIYYFSAIVNVFAGKPEDPVAKNGLAGASRDFPCLAQRMLTLAIYKAGDSNPQVRKGATRLLKSVELRLWGDEFLHEEGEGLSQLMEDNGGSTYEPLAIGSSLPVMYKYAQTMASSRLALERPQFTCEMISEICMRLEHVGANEVANPEGIRDILIFMLPWIRNLNLATLTTNILDTSTAGRSQGDDQTRKNYGDDYISEVENLWIQLVERRSFTQPETSTSLGDDEEDLRTEHHVDIIIDFLLAVGIRRRNPKFVAHAKKVIVYISRTSASDKLVNAIISRITPRSLIPIDASKIFEDADDQPPNRVSPDFYTINLSQILPDMPMRPAFGSGGLACVLLVDLTVELGSAPLLEHLALILHMIFIQLDHFITLVCEQMRLLLINIIQTIIPRKLGGSKIEVVLTKLDLKEGRRIWPYQDLSPSVREIESTKQLAELVADILSLCEIVEPSLSELWANVALSYAVGCPVRHSACRSLQIFSTIADTTEEVQGFALEILITLNTILKPLEWEFSEGVLILKKVLSELDLTSQSVRNGLLVNQPTKWRGQFMGVQPLLLRGLFSATTEKDTLDVINLLAEVDNDNLVDTSSSRVLFAVLANLVRLLQAYQPEPLEEGAESVDLNVEECLAVSERLSQLATRTKHMSLARLLSSYSKQRFRAKEDFGRQAVLIIRDTFFPDLEAPTLQFLIGLLRNKLPFYRKRGLQILKLLLPAISSKARPAVGNANGPWGPGWGVGWNSGGATNQSSSKVDWTTAAGSSLMNLEEDLINPLVEMLSSEMAEEALEVLDEVLSGGISFGETSLKSVRTTDPNKILAAGKDTGKSDSSKGRSEMPSGWRVTDYLRVRSIRSEPQEKQSSPLARVQTGSAGNELDSPSQSFNSSFSFVPELSLSLTEQSSSNNILEALNDLENYFGFDDDLRGISSDSIKGLSSDPSIERDYVRSKSVYEPDESSTGDEKRFRIVGFLAKVSYSAETLEPPISRDTSLSSLKHGRAFCFTSLSLPAKGGPGKSLRSSASPLSPKSHASASMRLLSQPFTYVQVVFRVFHANDPDITVFGIATLVEAQVKVALRLGNNEPVLISTFAEPVEKGRGFKITLSVKILENERNEPGKITLMAALAEELVALIHGEGEDRNLQEESFYSWDFRCPTSLKISASGSHIARVAPLFTNPQSLNKGSPWIRPDLDSTIIGPNTSFPRVSPQAQSRIYP
ncbi:cell morphogenesis C-terminal-domain-containing protein [Chytridium lagenaria]|nr:cell morphogenesis C-terminal-domain-containing protein [Chytridium lagenaria]